MITLITALEIESNYPDNILVEAVEDDGKWASYMYMTRNGDIHKMMLSTTPVFDSEEEAKDTMQAVITGAINHVRKEIKEQ